MSHAIQDDPSTLIDESKLAGKGSSSDKVIFEVIVGLVILSLIALFPLATVVALIAGITTFSLFYYRRWRVSAIFQVSILVGIVCLLGFMLTSPHIAVDKLFMHVISANKVSVMGKFALFWLGTIYLSWITAAVGALIGVLIVVFAQQNLSMNLELFKTLDTHFYGWRYARTLLQYLRRNSLIKRLKNKTFKVKNGFPAGIEDEPIMDIPENPSYIRYDEPISLYDSEAYTHRIITGASGSGKMLSGDTLIPTKFNGFKPIRDILVGETLFDQNGNPCTVKAKFHPYIKDTYVITFEDGTKVRAGGDHLWTVTAYEAFSSNKWEKVTLDTRTMLKYMQNNNVIYTVPACKPVKYESKIDENAYMLGKQLANEPSNLADMRRTKYAPIFSATVEQRKDFLNGFLEVANPSQKPTIIMRSRRLLDDIRTLACSLGYIMPTVKRKTVFSLSYRLNVTPIISSKQAKNKDKQLIMSIKQLWFDNKKDYYCLTVDSPDRLFLCSKSYIPTHNTITMQNSILHDMEVGKTVFVLDCKGDAVFAAKLAKWSKDLGCNFYHFAPNMAGSYRIQQNPDGVAFYDPLAHSDVTQNMNMFLSIRDWDTASSYYRSNAQSFLSRVFAIMAFMDRNNKQLQHRIDMSKGNFWIFKSLLDDVNTMKIAAESIPDNNSAKPAALELVEQLSSNGRSEKDRGSQGAFADYRAVLQGMSLVEGKYMITPQNSECKTIDIFKLSSQPHNVVLFSLLATKSGDTGAQTGSLICTDLTDMTGYRAANNLQNPISIYIDEFESLPTESVLSMIAKARSAKVGITLAFQSFEQIIGASSNGEAFVRSMIETCGSFIFHSGASQISAERMASILGMEKKIYYATVRRKILSIFATNFLNRRVSNNTPITKDEYIVDPSVFQQLSAPRAENGYKSEAIIIKRASADRIDKNKTHTVAHKVHMIPPSMVLDDTVFDNNSPIIPCIGANSVENQPKMGEKSEYDAYKSMNQDVRFQEPNSTVQQYDLFGSENAQNQPNPAKTANSSGRNMVQNQANISQNSDFNPNFEPQTAQNNSFEPNMTGFEQPQAYDYGQNPSDYAQIEQLQPNMPPDNNSGEPKPIMTEAQQRKIDKIKAQEQARQAAYEAQSDDLFADEFQIDNYADVDETQLNAANNNSMNTANNSSVNTVQNTITIPTHNKKPSHKLTAEPIKPADSAKNEAAQGQQKPIKKPHHTLSVEPKPAQNKTNTANIAASKNNTSSNNSITRSSTSAHRALRLQKMANNSSVSDENTTNATAQNNKASRLKNSGSSGNSENSLRKTPQLRGNLRIHR